jgi:threonine dehydratase
VIGLKDVQAAAERIGDAAHRTPVLTSRTLDERAGASVFVKAEHLQRGGSFKIRGATNRVAALSDDERRRGVFAYSSGNHAQAVAIAAAGVGAKAVVLMPADAPASKLAATRGYGAQVVTYDRYRDDRVSMGARMASERNMTLVPPYDDPLVMAGQGTVALELLDAVAGIDVLLVPIGGGGLIAGCATAAKALRPGMQVYGVEPERGDDTRRSLREGHRVRIDVPDTIADGLQADVPGELTFEVNRKVVDDILTVSDDQIVDAMRFLFERMKTVVEPSGAVAVAAALAAPAQIRGRRAGVVISGGNVDAARFAELTATGAGAEG